MLSLKLLFLNAYLEEHSGSLLSSFNKISKLSIVRNKTISDFLNYITFDLLIVTEDAKYSFIVLTFVVLMILIFSANTRKTG